MAPPFITHLEIKNYKSIASCSLDLRPLSIFVGPNGAGKSNVLDALRFLRDALRGTPAEAARNRSAIGHCTGPVQNPSFELRVDVSLPENARATYSLRVDRVQDPDMCVGREQCQLYGPDGEPTEHRFDVDAVGRGVWPSDFNGKPMPDRLALTCFAHLLPFRDLYLCLAGMGFYSIRPGEMRSPKKPDVGHVLAPDGQNIASILHALEETDPAAKQRIEQYLAAILPGFSSVARDPLDGRYETLEFMMAPHAHGASEEAETAFLADSMSDGTLRALGVLTALFQHGTPGRPDIPLVGVEEPETALHPAATRVLVEAALEASESRQVLLTTHSPDMLDAEDIDPESIFAVQMRHGQTVVTPLDEITKATAKSREYTLGELLRDRQLEPDPDYRPRTHSQETD